QAVRMLSEGVLAGSLPLSLRKSAASALGQSWPGEAGLVECVQDPSFDKALAPTAAGVLLNAYRIAIQREAEKYLERPATVEGKSLPPIRDLVVTIGNAEKGAAVFSQYCQACHAVNGNGTNFGPALSNI